MTARKIISVTNLMDQAYLCLIKIYCQFRFPKKVFCKVQKNGQRGNNDVLVPDIEREFYKNKTFISYVAKGFQKHFENVENLLVLLQRH